MKLPDCREISLHLEGGVLSITLDRPRARNAMNLQLVDEMTRTFDAIAQRPEVRIAVLRGADGNFCAGGDIKDMNNAGVTPADGEDPLFKLNRAFGHMLTRVNHAPQVVISLLEGAVLGGGFGLACVSDIAIADVNAQFGMPETGLGLPPAQIAPFVVLRVGLMQARRLVLTGARFDGEQARELGIVHFTTHSKQEMQDLLAQQIKQIKGCAPHANRVTKQLILAVGEQDNETLLDKAAEYFSAAATGPEGHEGMRAFVEKRAPQWAK